MAELSLDIERERERERERETERDREREIMKHTDVQVVFRFLFNRKTPAHLHLQAGLCTLV